MSISCFLAGFGSLIGSSISVAPLGSSQNQIGVIECGMIGQKQAYLGQFSGETRL
ncbi:hypothetical protein [Acidomonas methanolica]|uniref:hypothetical protein n=1 Tax=Acidomonas methanolica TaxID=437 RepID=UPI00130DC0B2|nr:hypothetical protein [Acidomonas methanolica]